MEAVESRSRAAADNSGDQEGTVDRRIGKLQIPCRRVGAQHDRSGNFGSGAGFHRGGNLPVGRANPAHGSAQGQAPVAAQGQVIVQRDVIGQVDGCSVGEERGRRRNVHRAGSEASSIEQNHVRPVVDRSAQTGVVRIEDEKSAAGSSESGGAGDLRVDLQLADVQARVVDREGAIGSPKSEGSILDHRRRGSPELGAPRISQGDIAPQGHRAAVEVNPATEGRTSMKR